MKHVKLILATVVALLVIGVGYMYVADDIHTYDQRFSDCVEVQKALLPMPLRYHFRAEEHQAMMRDCDRQANQR